MALEQIETYPELDNAFIAKKAELLVDVANVYSSLSESSAEIKYLELSAELYRKLTKDTPNDLLSSTYLANIYFRLGSLFMQQKNYSFALSKLQEALALVNRVKTLDATNDGVQALFVNINIRLIEATSKSMKVSVVDQYSSNVLKYIQSHPYFDPNVRLDFTTSLAINSAYNSKYATALSIFKFSYLLLQKNPKLFSVKNISFFHDEVLNFSSLAESKGESSLALKAYNLSLDINKILMDNDHDKK